MEGFSEILKKWYQSNKRELPWRNTMDPYPIWLSEIILQQTRVEQGLPYFHKFIKHYPTIDDLANASEDELLKDWQGLGYYSRCRNLHAAAKQVQQLGKFPSNYSEIIQLKGVGEYTAAAIASFAFKENVAVLDGNVIRVLTRFFGIEDDTSNPKTIRSLRVLANDLLPESESDIHNQAIMEFGALQCKPKGVDCMSCPVSNQCVAFSNNKVDKLPFKSKKTKVRTRYFNYIVLKHNDAFALKKRTEKDIWQGLYDFPLMEGNGFMHISEINNHLKSEFNASPISISLSEEFNHILSHQKIKAQFFLIELNQEISPTKNNVKWVKIDEMNEIGKPILIQNYLNKYIF